MTTPNQPPRRPSFTDEVDDYVEFTDGGPPGIRPVPLDFSPGLMLTDEVDDVVEFTDAAPLPNLPASGTESVDPQTQSG